MTKVMQLKGTTVHLNAKSDFGEIVVEVLDANDKPLARSKPIQRDGLDIPVEWAEPVERLPEFAKLRIHLKNARLFALWCSP